MPEGELVVRLYEGAVGPTRLAQAQARAAVDARQRLTFSADLVPAEAGRHAGHMHVAGGLPLRPTPPGAAGMFPPRSICSPWIDCRSTRNPTQSRMPLALCRWWLAPPCQPHGHCQQSLAQLSLLYAQPAPCQLWCPPRSCSYSVTP